MEEGECQGAPQAVGASAGGLPPDGPHISWRSASVSECLGKSWVH